MYSFREKRGKPLFVDPGLYSSHKSDVFEVMRKRELPTAFKLFTGDISPPLTRMSSFRILLVVE